MGAASFSFPSWKGCMSLDSNAGGRLAYGVGVPAGQRGPRSAPTPIGSHRPSLRLTRFFSRQLFPLLDTQWLFIRPPTNSPHWRRAMSHEVSRSRGLRGGGGVNEASSALDAPQAGAACTICEHLMCVCRSMEPIAP